MRHKIFAIVLALVLSITISHSNVNAGFTEVTALSNDEVMHQIEDLLTEGYQEYYDIDHFDFTICDDGTYFVEMTATLKADSVEELDYYQGAMHYMTEHSFTYEASQYLTEQLYDNFSNYIGTEQVLNFYIAADINTLNRSASCNLMFEDGLGYVTADEIYPPSHNELFNSGYSYIKDSTENSAESYSTSAQRSNNSVFSVYNAVWYSESYTSNPTSCNLHTDCGKLVDTTKYNPSYTHYAATHTDCANFVSQTLHAGGIPTSTTWYAGATNWKSVAGLCSYMLDNGYWESIDKSDLFVGDYMRYTAPGESHIVMITAHDGVSYRYSGHTNDRQNVVTSLSGSKAFYHVTY